MDSTTFFKHRKRQPPFTPYKHCMRLLVLTCLNKLGNIVHPEVESKAHPGSTFHYKTTHYKKLFFFMPLTYRSCEIYILLTQLVTVVDSIHPGGSNASSLTATCSDIVTGVTHLTMKAQSWVSTWRTSTCPLAGTQRQRHHDTRRRLCHRILSRSLRSFLFVFYLIQTAEKLQFGS